MLIMMTIESTDHRDKPYVRRPPSSQWSLETCTERLGSETGSDDYFSDECSWSSARSEKERAVDDDNDDVSDEFVGIGKADAVNYHHYDVSDEFVGIGKADAVNYHHCSISGRSPRRPFPPPLPSISCHDRPCVQMRPHRKDGRLVVEAVPVPSQNYLRAERCNGRLLSFVNTSARRRTQEAATELEDREGVEVIADGGTAVKAKASTRLQRQSGGTKAHRSSIVGHCDDNKPVGDTRRCSQMRKPLFIWEPSCIAAFSLIR